MPWLNKKKQERPGWEKNNRSNPRTSFIYAEILWTIIKQIAEIKQFDGEIRSKAVWFGDCEDQGGEECEK